MLPVRNLSVVLLFTLLLGLLLLPQLQAAEPALTPTTPPEGVQMADAVQVQTLQANGAIVVDARKAAEFAEGSIKGAVSVPYDPEQSAKDISFDASKDKYDLSSIADKSKSYIVYCNASSCWKSYKLVTVMARAGYKHLYWYRDGFPDWKARRLPVE
ncbi:rhodanese-like domain-containing protein [Candidatus Magnetaquicoccus inordinatus]|uniref:rhodanese-like domain-containing protein n=1 Tax=Candidatus Magnetaquicoccus inordinatus TaxID=2496818 RepID=UPI00102C58D1|nr:rhodanese-like domain-containing protein [Candidatus Magnetaquicoccus inordinatus]